MLFLYFCPTKVPQTTDLYSKLADSDWCYPLLLNVIDICICSGWKITWCQPWPGQSKIIGQTEISFELECFWFAFYFDWQVVLAHVLVSLLLLWGITSAALFLIVISASVKNIKKFLIIKYPPPPSINNDRCFLSVFILIPIILFQWAALLCLS